MWGNWDHTAEILLQQSSLKKYLHQFTIKHLEKWWKNEEGIGYVSGLRYTSENTDTWVSAEPMSATLFQCNWRKSVGVSTSIFYAYGSLGPEKLLKQTHTTNHCAFSTVRKRNEVQCALVSVRRIWNTLIVPQKVREAVGDPLSVYCVPKFGLVGMKSI